MTDIDAEYEASFEWIAQNEDELMLRPGDGVQVIERDESGWWYGTNLVTGHEGLFPKNYVKLRTPVAVAPAPPPPKKPVGLSASRKGAGSPGLTNTYTNTNTTTSTTSGSNAAVAASTADLAAAATAAGLSPALLDLYGNLDSATLGTSTRFTITSLDAFDELMDSGVSVEVTDTASDSSKVCVQPGMLVTLKCKAMIWDGAETLAKPFAETTENSLLRFLVGRGHVVPGLDCAMSRLAVGDSATVACNPSMCYGEAGQPPAVPPNSSIVYELTVLSAEICDPCMASDIPSGPPLLVTKIVESRRLSMRSSDGQLGGNRQQRQDSLEDQAMPIVTQLSAPVAPVAAPLMVPGVDNPLSDEEIRQAVRLMGLTTSSNSAVGLDTATSTTTTASGSSVTTASTTSTTSTTEMAAVVAPAPVPPPVSLAAALSTTTTTMQSPPKPPKPTAAAVASSACTVAGASSNPNPNPNPVSTTTTITPTAVTSASVPTSSIPSFTVSYQALKATNSSCNDLHGGLDLSRKEMYLSDTEFTAVMGMDRSAFAALAEWKRIKLKKATGLF